VDSAPDLPVLADDRFEKKLANAEL
jgi:hypothetical protein